MPPSNVRKLVTGILKWLISLAILGYLIRRAVIDGTFDSLGSQPKNWYALAAALALAVTCLFLAATRWWMLVRCLPFSLRWRDAVRLSMMGYLINNLSIGVAGEDLFKGFYLSHQHGKGRRTEAFSTVLVDRVIGVYSLFLLAAVGVLLNGTWRSEAGPTVAFLSRLALIAFGIGTIAIAFLFTPILANDRTAELAGKVPWIGTVIRNLVTAIKKFRRQPAVLLTALTMGLAIHLLYVLTIYLTAVGVRVDPPTLLAHLVIVPQSSLVTLIPLPMGSLGAWEFAFSFLYGQVGGSEQGLVVALAYRAITILVLIVSAIVYAMRSTEADEALHEAEEAER